MNREIADAPAWGKQQIFDRADQFAERMITLWPGPIENDGEEAGDGRDWTLLRQACAALPAGSWITYGDLVPHQATFALLMVSALVTTSRSVGWLAG